MGRSAAGDTTSNESFGGDVETPLALNTVTSQPCFAAGCPHHSVVSGGGTGKGSTSSTVPVGPQHVGSYPAACTNHAQCLGVHHNTPPQPLDCPSPGGCTGPLPLALFTLNDVTQGAFKPGMACASMGLAASGLAEQPVAAASKAAAQVPVPSLDSCWTMTSADLDAALAWLPDLQDDAPLQLEVQVSLVGLHGGAHCMAYCRFKQVS